MNLFELNILDFIQTLRCPAADFFFSHFTLLGNGGFLWIGITLLLLCFKKTRVFGLVCATALILDLLSVNLCLKPLIQRTRPFVLNPDIVLLIQTPPETSFPSGHTASSFAFAAALPASFRKWRTAAFVVAALIGLSRIYLYLHYPTDVLAGVAMGLVCGCCAKLIWKKLMPQAAKTL